MCPAAYCRSTSLAALAAFLLLTAAPRGAVAGDTLCAPHETAIFACRTGPAPGAKRAALCADESHVPWRLTYRFGTPGHIELTYPAPGETAAFRHAIISYAALGGDAVLFSRGPVTTALFYVLGHDTSFDGVAVRQTDAQGSDAEIANLSCAEGSLDDLTTDFFKAAALPKEDGQFAVPEVFFDRRETRQ